MMLAALLIAGVVFYETFFALKSHRDAAAMQETVSAAFAVTQSTTMSDDEKAVAMRKSSVRMMGSVGLVIAKIAAACLAAAALLYLVSLFAWPFESLVSYSLRPLPLIATVSFVCLYGMVRHGRRKRRER